MKQEQKSEEYTRLNPMREVPTLLIDGRVLRQSPAIIEYLEETRPQPSLLPADPYQRHLARQLACLVACDIQPVQNLRVLQRVSELGGEAARTEWARRVVREGFEAMEATLREFSATGPYCLGDRVTLPDLFLVPQLYNARRFGLDLQPFPTLLRIEAALQELEPFRRAHPDRQPDAQPAA